MKSLSYRFTGCLVTSTAAILVLWGASAKAANPPVDATPTSVPVTGGIADAETATLEGSADWNVALSETLTAQGFTAANNWDYNPDPLSLQNNLTWNVTTYTLAATGVRVSEQMIFNLAGLPNNVGTIEWLQLINESAKFPGENGPFGLTIPGFSGYWGVDNGDLAPGNGPFYSSNGGPSGATYSPPNFKDTPNQNTPPGSYLYFWTVPAYVSDVNGVQTIQVLGNDALSWGWSVPDGGMTLALLGISLTGLRLFRRN